MSETIELPKPKRVYKKKATATPEPLLPLVVGGLNPQVATPIQEPIAIPIPEPIDIPEPPVLTRATNEPTPIKEKKPRSAKQIEAFNRMREAKQKKKQEQHHEPECVTPHTTTGGLGVSPNEPEPIIQIQEPIKQKRTYKKKEPQQVYIDARTINTVKPETYNEPPIYTQQVPQKIQEKTFRPYIFV